MCLENAYRTSALSATSRETEKLEMGNEYYHSHWTCKIEMNYVTVTWEEISEGNQYGSFVFFHWRPKH